MNKNHKLVVITGAASGIGLEMARVCLSHNMSVYMVDNQQALLNTQMTALQQDFEGLVHGAVCDVTDELVVNQLAASIQSEFGYVHWLINNAGITSRLVPVWELSHDEIHRVTSVNLYGATNMIRAFMPLLRVSESRSRIINIASMYGLCNGSRIGAYAFSKHALVSLSETLYFDLCSQNMSIDVSVACPSFVNTSLMNQSDDALQQSMAPLLAHSRSADDVASLIIEAALDGQFYILPDREVKNYCSERMEAIISQKVPQQNTMDKLLSRLFAKHQK